MNQNFMEKALDGESRDCPCCGQHVKLYKRIVDSTIARQLIKLYQKNGKNEYVHVSQLIINGTSVCDMSRARFWGLITEQENKNEDKRSSGYWMLTERGLNFVERRVKIPRYKMMYNKTVIDTRGEYVSIDECLGKKFSYKELMMA